MSQPLQVSVVLCTVDRAAVLHDTVLSLLEQTYPIEEILIGTPYAHAVLEETLALPGVRRIDTPLGLTRQRNACLAQVKPSSALVAFADDDMEFRHDYLSEVVRVFREHPEVVAASGQLLHDGGIDAPVSREEARVLCRGAEQDSAETSPRVQPRAYAYGCNMIFRAEAIRGLLFDEDLPLYAWLEDSDFSHRAVRGRSQGPVTCLQAKAVHLGWQGGRVSGLRLGFSQIVNPLYLWKRSRTFSIRHFVVQYWGRCLMGNVLGTIRGPEIEDRPGRLRGNLKGLWHVARGHCEPSLAAQLGRNDSRPGSRRGRA